MADLRQLLDEHLKRPFPTAVVKGADYAGVDCVMVDSDIYGWALTVSRGGTLSEDQRTRFTALKDELARALPSFPASARPYYDKLVEIAEVALSKSS